MHRAPVYAPTAAILAMTFAVACSEAAGEEGDAGADGDGMDDATFVGASSDVGLEVSGGCGPLQIISPILSVVDARTGKPICDVALVDSNDDTLSPCFGDDGCTAACQYTVAELSGSSTATFGLTVSAPGYANAQVSDLTPTECGCDAGPCQAPQQVTVSLVALDAGVGGPDAGTDGGRERARPGGDAATDGRASNQPPDVVVIDAADVVVSD